MILSMNNSGNVVDSGVDQFPPLPYDVKWNLIYVHQGEGFAVVKDTGIGIVESMVDIEHSNALVLNGNIQERDNYYGGLETYVMVSTPPVVMVSIPPVFCIRVNMDKWRFNRPDSYEDLWLSIGGAHRNRQFIMTSGASGNISIVPTLMKMQSLGAYKAMGSSTQTSRPMATGDGRCYDYLPCWVEATFLNV